MIGRTAFASLSALALLPCLGCDRSNEPEQSSAVRSTVSARPAAAGSHQDPPGLPPGTLILDPPPTWTRSPKQLPMRKATYIVPHSPSDSEDGDLSVSQAGGSVEQNLSRWAGQFGQTVGDAKQRTKKVHGLAVTIVEIHGDYTGMAMPGAPAAGKRNSWALLGAIIETSPPHFLKLTGPDATVSAAREDFERFVDSARLK